MKSEKRGFVLAAFSMAAVLVLSCLLTSAEAFRGAREVEGPRGGEAVEGPRGNVAAEGPRGNIAVGTRYNVLPETATALVVGERTYYVDEGGVYYLPCEDDETVYCVVEAPE